MDEKAVAKPHTLHIDNRNLIILTGITDVGSFNEESVQLETSMGGLEIRGENLQVTKLSLESGDVSVEGSISSVVYTAPSMKSTGFLSRVFG